MLCTNCNWSEGLHESPIFATLTCGDNYTPKVRNVRNSVAPDPDRCADCGEVYTPRITKGSIKCKCDQPKPPRWVLDAMEYDDRPSPAINRGRSA